MKMVKQVEFEEKILEIAKNVKSEESEIQELVKESVISKTFGKYLHSLCNLIGCMEMAGICERYKRNDERVIALESAEHDLERATAVYLSSDERYGWTQDKMDAYMNGELPVGHKELVDLAMGIKEDKTGQRIYLVDSRKESATNN